LAFVALVTLLGWGVIADAQALAIDRLGRHTVGSKLSDVRSYRTTEHCDIEEDFADCKFVDPNGVSYVMFEDSVTWVIADEKTVRSSVKLPFTLKFGDEMGVVVQKLVAEGRTWSVLVDRDNRQKGVVFSSKQRYSGENGWDFTVEIVFEKGRLVRVSYNSGAI
jgi:hypothetical protein